MCSDSHATWGSPVRAYSSGADAYIVKLSSSGSLTWNTFLGGSSTDRCYDLGVDGNGNIAIGGIGLGTWGTPVTAHAGGEDGMAAQVSSSGALNWNTFLGSSSQDQSWGAAVDSAGNVYVAGVSTATWGSPVRAYSAGSDGHVAKFPETPTLAGLLSFDATIHGDTVTAAWETVSELDVLGFHVWRRPVDGAAFVRATEAIIPARGSTVEGASYTWVDEGVGGAWAYLYVLERLATDGLGQLGEPVVAIDGD